MLMLDVAESRDFRKGEGKELSGRRQQSLMVYECRLSIAVMIGVASVV